MKCAKRMYESVQNSVQVSRVCKCEKNVKCAKKYMEVCKNGLSVKKCVQKC